MYSWYSGDQKWLGKTIEVSQKALELDPNSIEAQFGVGAVYFHQKRFGDAKRMWEKVIQQNPVQVVVNQRQSDEFERKQLKQDTKEGKL